MGRSVLSQGFVLWTAIQPSMGESSGERWSKRERETKSEREREKFVFSFGNRTTKTRIICSTSPDPPKDPDRGSNRADPQHAPKADVLPSRARAWPPLGGSAGRGPMRVSPWAPEPPALGSLSPSLGSFNGPHALRTMATKVGPADLWRSVPSRDTRRAEGSIAGREGRCGYGASLLD